MKLNEDIKKLIDEYCTETGDFGMCITHFGKIKSRKKVIKPKNFIEVPVNKITEHGYSSIWIRKCDCVIINIIEDTLQIQLYQDRDAFNWVVADIEKQCDVKIFETNN